MLILTMALISQFSSCCCQLFWVTSISKGNSKLSTRQAFFQATMLSLAKKFTSEGIQRHNFNSEAKKMACSPVPLAISRILILVGKICQRIFKIGDRLR
jgi:hypothetical protein